MIEIRRGNHILTVSQNTYETMFKRMGYHIVEEEAKTKASSTITKKHQEAKEDVLSVKANNLTLEPEKTVVSQPDAKESNSDENNNKLEDILGIISNSKKTSENSKKKKEE